MAGVAPTAALPKAQTHDLDRLILTGAQVDPSATVVGGSTIGAGARVDAQAFVRGSVVMDDAQIGAGARVESSVLGHGTRVGAGAVLVGVVVGDGAVIGAGCELLDGARVWPGTELPAGSIRFSAGA